MEKGGVRAALMNAVLEATKKAEELGKRWVILFCLLGVVEFNFNFYFIIK